MTPSQLDSRPAGVRGPERCISGVTIAILALFLSLGSARPLAGAEAADDPGAATEQQPAGPEPEHLLVARARVEAVQGNVAEAMLLIETYRALHPEDKAAERLEMILRIEQRREDARALIKQHVAEKNLILGDPDYEAAKAEASLEVIRSLRSVEYLIHENKFNQAIDLCERIVTEYEKSKPAMMLLDRLLLEINRVEKENLERARSRRNSGVEAEVVEAGTMPRQPSPRPREVIIFDEDIAALEREALMKRLRLPVPGFNYKNAAVKDVLEELFAYAGLDFVVVEGALPETTITAYLVDRTVEDILAVLQRMVDVSFNYHNGLVYISNSENPILTTKVIRLRSGLTNVLKKREAKGGGGGGSGGGGGGGSRSGGGGDGNDTPFSIGGGGGGGGGGGDAATDLERFLEAVPSLVDWPDGSEMYLEHKSNTLYVKSSPAAISEIERLLHALDYNSTMIMIETKFVEVSNEAAMNLGLQWGLLGRDNRDGGTMAWGAARGSPIIPDPNATGDSLVDDFLGQFSSQTGPGLSTAIVGGGPGIRPNFSVLLNALESKGHANVLSAPQIMTLNNAIGVIDLSVDVPYISGYNNISVPNYIDDDFDDDNNTSFGSAQIEPEWSSAKEGFTLEIHPSIARNTDVITLELVPTVTEILNRAQLTASGSFSEGENTSTALFITREPEIATRTLNTILHVKDGETIALGGLITERENQDTQGLPYLMRIPGLGRVFRSDSDSLSRSKLMIFVTARIIDPSGAELSDEIRYLRDTARVVLPANVREEIHARERLEAEATRKRAAEMAAEQRAMRKTLGQDIHDRRERVGP